MRGWWLASGGYEERDLRTTTLGFVVAWVVPVVMVHIVLLMFTRRHMCSVYNPCGHKTFRIISGKSKRFCKESTLGK